MFSAGFLSSAQLIPGRYPLRSPASTNQILPNPLTFNFNHKAMVGRTLHIPPLPRDLADLKARIIAAVKNIDAPILTHVWQELECRINVCRITRCAHIEPL
jgi:hypothetical protein